MSKDNMKELLQHKDPITTVYMHGLKYEVNQDTRQACFFVEDIEENSQHIGGKKFLWQSQKWIVMLYDESKIQKRRKTKKMMKRSFRRRTKSESEGFKYEVTEVISLDVKEDHDGTSHFREYTWKPKVVNTEESFIMVTYPELSSQPPAEDIVKHKSSSLYQGNVCHDDFEITYDFADDTDFDINFHEPPLGALAKLSYVSEKLIHITREEAEDDQDVSGEETYSIAPINIKLSYEPTVLWVEPYDGRYGLSTSHFELSERHGNSCETSLLKVTTRGGYLSDFSLSYSDARKIKKYRHRKESLPRYNEIPSDVIVIDRLDEGNEGEKHEHSDDEGFEEIVLDFDKKVNIELYENKTKPGVSISPQSNYGSYIEQAYQNDFQHQTLKDIALAYASENKTFSDEFDSGISGSEAAKNEQEVAIDEEDGAKHFIQNDLIQLKNAVHLLQREHQSKRINEEILLPKQNRTLSFKDVNFTKKETQGKHNLLVIPTVVKYNNCCNNNGNIKKLDRIDFKNQKIKIDEEILEANNHFKNPDYSKEVNLSLMLDADSSNTDEICNEDTHKNLIPEDLIKFTTFECSVQKEKDTNVEVIEDEVISAKMDRVRDFKVNVTAISKEDIKLSTNVQATPVSLVFDVEDNLNVSKKIKGTAKKKLKIDEEQSEEIKKASKIFKVEKEFDKLINEEKHNVSGVEKDEEDKYSNSHVNPLISLSQELSDFQILHSKDSLTKNPKIDLQQIDDESILPKTERSMQTNDKSEQINNIIVSPKVEAVSIIQTAVSGPNRAIKSSQVKAKSIAFVDEEELNSCNIESKIDVNQLLTDIEQEPGTTNSTVVSSEISLIDYIDTGAKEQLVKTQNEENVFPKSEKSRIHITKGKHNFHVDSTPISREILQAQPVNQQLNYQLDIDEIKTSKIISMEEKKIVVEENPHEAKYKKDNTDVAISEVFANIVNAELSIKSNSKKSAVLPEELSDFKAYQCQGIMGRLTHTKSNKLLDEVVNSKSHLKKAKSITENKDINKANMLLSRSIHATPINYNLTRKVEEKNMFPHSVKKNKVTEEQCNEIHKTNKMQLTEELSDKNIYKNKCRVPEELSEFSDCKSKNMSKEKLITECQKPSEEEVLPKSQNTNLESNSAEHSTQKLSSGPEKADILATCQKTKENDDDNDNDDDDEVEAENIKPEQHTVNEESCVPTHYKVNEHEDMTNFEILSLSKDISVIANDDDTKNISDSNKTKKSKMFVTTKNVISGTSRGTSHALCHVDLRVQSKKDEAKKNVSSISVELKKNLLKDQTTEVLIAGQNEEDTSIAPTVGKTKRSLSYRAKKMIMKTFKPGKPESKVIEENGEQLSSDQEKTKKKSKFAFSKTRSFEDKKGTSKSRSKMKDTVSNESKKYKPKYERGNTMPVKIISLNDRESQYRSREENLVDQDERHSSEQSHIVRLTRSQSFDSTLESRFSSNDNQLKERRRRLAGYSYVSPGLFHYNEIVKSREYTVEACEKEMEKEITLVKRQRKKQKNAKSMETSLDVIEKMQSIKHVQIPNVFLGSVNANLGCVSPKLKVGRIQIPKAFSVADNLNDVGKDNLKS